MSINTECYLACNELTPNCNISSLDVIGNSLKEGINKVQACVNEFTKTTTPLPPNSLHDRAEMLSPQECGDVGLPQPETCPLPLSVITKNPELKGSEKYYALLAENESEKPRDFIMPKRRLCNFGGCESQHTINRARKATENGNFLTKNEIVEVHSLKFLRRSPFVNQPCSRMKKTLDKLDQNPIQKGPDGKKCNAFDSLFDSLQKELEAIAVTKNGKHVILQQTIKSCVPTCVAMLVLDHEKVPDYRAIEKTYLANQDQATKWVTKAGLNPKMTDLSDHQNDKAEFLVQCLAMNGPGVLAITHPEIRAHVLVLDEISIEANTAVIRDSFHGWMLTMKLDCLMSWVDKHAYFLQITPDTV